MLCLTQKVEHSIYVLLGENLELNSGDLRLMSECLSITVKLIFD